MATITVRRVTPEAPVYGTKYALTRGVQTFTEGSVIREGEALYYKATGEFWSLLQMNKDAWEEPEAAEADARGKARKRVASLKKQLPKLEALAQEAKWEG